jgi:hypothetical protein
MVGPRAVNDERNHRNLFEQAGFDPGPASLRERCETQDRPGFSTGRGIPSFREDGVGHGS